MSDYLYIRSHPERVRDACLTRSLGTHNFNLSNV